MSQHRTGGSLGALPAFQSAGAAEEPQPLGFSVAEDRLGGEYAEDTLDAPLAARRRLSEDISMAVVLREPLPPALGPQLQHCCGEGGARVSALSLALPGSDGAPAGSLLQVSILAPAPHAPAEPGSMGGEGPAQASALGPGTAAFACYTAGRPLVWRASQGRPHYTDWQALAQAPAAGQQAQEEPGSGSGAVLPARGLVTVPLLPAGASTSAAPLGAATFDLEEEPAAGDVEVLCALGASLAASIQHHTKALWEESLGFLTRVIPPRVVQRMLSAALSTGPMAAAAAAATAAAPNPAGVAAVLRPRLAAAAAAPAAAADAAEPATPCAHTPGAGPTMHPAQAAARFRPFRAAAEPRSSPGGSGEDGGSFGSCAVGSGASGTGRSTATGPAQPGAGAADEASADTSKRGGGAAGGAGPAAHAPTAATGPDHEERVLHGAHRSSSSSGSNSSGRHPPLSLEVKTLRQKWNLEFADPGLEDAFKLWFNSLQTRTDLAVFRWFSLLLLVLAVALAVRGGTTLGDLLAMTHGLLSVAALGAAMLLNTGWYIDHRSAVVAMVRITSAGLLLMHAYTDPGFYSGSLLKGLAGSCALTLVANSFRNRLRFSNHLLVQLAKLYLCAMANAFIYSDPARAACTHLSLPATTAVQSLCALLPSIAVYRLEAGLRRRFLRAGVEAGILVLPAPAPAPGAATGIGSPAVASHEVLHVLGGNGVHAARFK